MGITTNPDMGAHMKRSTAAMATHSTGMHLGTPTTILGRLLAPTILFDPDPPAPPVDPPAPTPPPEPPVTPPAPEPPDPSVLSDIAAMATELGISPEQLKGRLEASRKWEQRAKKADEDLEAARLAGLDETQRAIEQAKIDGKAEATASFAETLAAAKIEAALTGVVPAAEIPAVIDDLKLSNYLTDGAVDADKVAALRTRVAAFAAPPAPGSGDGGPRGGSAPDPTIDDQIAAARAAGNTRLAISLNNLKLANPVST